VLERNPYYWKVDRDSNRLPYLDELVFLFVGSEDQQVMRFEAGERTLVSRLSAENYALLSREQSRQGWQLADLGPAWNNNFLVFTSMISTPETGDITRKQAWFRDLKFRRQCLLPLTVIDRAAGVWRQRHGAMGNVGPGNRLG